MAAEDVLIAKAAPTGGDLFAFGQGHVERIKAAYGELMAAEQGKSEPDAVKLQALGPQLKYLAELQGALEGSAHDGLVRVSDRLDRFGHWQEGVFL